MVEQEQKPFLTVETGEAYQPIRLTYEVLQQEKLIAILSNLKCLEKNPHAEHSWLWFWHDECNDLHFESLDIFNKKDHKDVRLATLTLKGNELSISLSSFKRACLAVPFFHSIIPFDVAHVHHADYINKVYGLDERLPHGLKDIFHDEDLKAHANKRIEDYNTIQEKIENAETTEEAFEILSSYNANELKKKIPFAERYDFRELKENADPDTVFLGFYVFLRTRELVAIRRWFGNAEYSLKDATDETIQQVFGDMDIDLID